MKLYIRGLSRAAVLAALYNAAKPQGASFIRYDPEPMTEDEAEAILAEQSAFGYLRGRAMHIGLSNDDSIDPVSYDHDNGVNHAADVIAELRKTGDVNSPAISMWHRTAVTTSIIETRGHFRRTDGPVDPLSRQLSAALQRLSN
jgi:hypothetical protein